MTEALSFCFLVYKLLLSVLIDGDKLKMQKEMTP
jgi:hypothetical protein